jgi:glucokinase
LPQNSHDGPDDFLQRIAALVADLSNRAGGRPVALGMRLPGLVDVAKGITRFLPNLPTQWCGVRVGETLTQALGCPVFLLNDARMATLGEYTFGRGKRADTMIFLTIDTGIGGGILVDGKLRLGALGAAGEIGHQTILRDGPHCGCGNRSCLEALASGPELVGEGIRLMQSGLAPVLFEMVAGNVGAVSPKEMGAAARSGDTEVGEAIARVGSWLGVGIANMVTALYPDLVILGGSVAALDDLLLDPVRETVKRARSHVSGPGSVDRAVIARRFGGHLGRHRTGRQVAGGDVGTQGS